MRGDLPSSGGGGPSGGPGPLTGQGGALAVIAAGGALGALARYGVGLVLPAPAGVFPLATFLVNVTGCLLIGALVVVVTEVRTTHPLMRPFLTTGILGGYTTFSTYAADAVELLRAGRTASAAAYVVGTLTGAVTATWLGIRLGRAALGGAR